MTHHDAFLGTFSLLAIFALSLWSWGVHSAPTRAQPATEVVR